MGICLASRRRRLLKYLDEHAVHGHADDDEQRRNAQRERIQIDPAQYSLGCYPAATRETGATFLLELRHVRRGPVAALTLVHLTSRQFQSNQRILDRCVNTLAERLQIRRSGAPLLMGTDLPHAR